MMRNHKVAKVKGSYVRQKPLDLKGRKVVMFSRNDQIAKVKGSYVLPHIQRNVNPHAREEAHVSFFRYGAIMLTPKVIQ